jgi:hypothetical protein
MKTELIAQPAINAFEEILQELESELSEYLLDKLMAVHRQNVAFFKVMEQANKFLIQSSAKIEYANEDLFA